MCAQILKRPSTQQIISSLNKCRTQTGERVSYEGFDYLWHSSAFETLVRFPDEIPSVIKHSLVSEALNAPTSSGNINFAQLEQALSEAEARYKRRRKKDYFLKSELSVTGNLPFKTFSLGDVKLLFKYSLDCEPIPDFDIRNPPFHGELPKGYQPVLISVPAKTPFEAGHLAIDMLDVVRGFWNLFLNKGYRMSSGKRQPVNTITLGPFYSLHDKNGKLIEPKLWHEPTYISGAKIYDISRNAEALRKQTLSFQRYIHASPFQKIIFDALKRYARALDGVDYDYSVMQLWSILESLTLSSEYDVVIRRAASVYSNVDEAKAVLDHLRFRRNDIVHKSASFSDAEGLIFQLKGVVEALTQKYIGMFSRHFSSKSEVETFLDMPRDPKMLSLGRRFIR